MTRLLAGAAVVALLAACDGGGRLEQERSSPFAPAGRGAIEDSVDGLIVGHRLMSAGEYELALEAYARAAIEEGRTVDVLSAAGSANLRLGRLGQAESQLREAVELDPSFPPAWNNLGVVLMETGEYGEATQVFRRAFALDSGQSVEIRDNLRGALARIERPDYNQSDSTFALVRRGRGDYLLLGAS